MHIWDWFYLAIPLGISLLLSFLVQWRKPDWSPLRLALVSAAILPTPILVLCIWLFVSSVRAPAAECGVDACGMAMMSAMLIGAAMLGLYLVGAAVIFGAQLLIRRL